MPNQLVNPDYPVDMSFSPQGDFEYEYPEGLDLKPGSDLHQKILSRLLMYGRESSRVVSQRRSSWNEMDEKLTAYIPTTQKEKDIKNRDRRKPVSIVFPYSYAILETLVSYLVAAFFPEPIFRYEGSAPEDIAGATLMQHLISQHCNRNKITLNLHTMFRDASAYGFGVVSPQWITKTGKVIKKNPTGFYDQNGRFVQDGEDIYTEEGTLFEGNGLQNIDPYCYLPDPNVSIHEVQKGEFVGWMDRDNYVNLLSEERLDEDLFNVRYLQQIRGKSSSIFSATSVTRRNQSRTRPDIIHSSIVTNQIDLLNIYVKLIPRDWNIGSSRYPEKWLFTVAGDAVIIKAKPLGLNHDMFPVCICSPDFDGYSPVAYSRLEILSGMQTTIDWLFNSHIANVRKAINDVLIVDPYLINIEDLKDPEPGGLIRLRRPAWGKGVKDAVQQLNVTDITRQNLADVSFLIQYMQQVGGTDNAVMGNLRSGGPERLSAREFQGTAQGAVSRLERIAKIIGVQGMQDIGYMFAHHAQQLSKEEVYLRTVGEWPRQVSENFAIKEGRIKMSPRDILVDYDLIVRDGSIPGGNFSDVWVQLFQTIGNSELLVQRFDIVRIFEYIATNLGAKNVAEFRIQQPPQIKTQVAPDEEISREVERGNLGSIFDELGVSA